MSIDGSKLMVTQTIQWVTKQRHKKRKNIIRNFLKVHYVPILKCLLCNIAAYIVNIGK